MPHRNAYGGAVAYTETQALPFLLLPDCPYGLPQKDGFTPTKSLLDRMSWDLSPTPIGGLSNNLNGAGRETCYGRGPKWRFPGAAVIYHRAVPHMRPIPWCAPATDPTTWVVYRAPHWLP